MIFYYKVTSIETIDDFSLPFVQLCCSLYKICSNEGRLPFTLRPFSLTRETRRPTCRENCAASKNTNGIYRAAIDLALVSQQETNMSTTPVSFVLSRCILLQGGKKSLSLANAEESYIFDLMEITCRKIDRDFMFQNFFFLELNSALHIKAMGKTFPRNNSSLDKWQKIFLVI